MDISKLHYISQAPAQGSHLTAIEKVLRSGGKWIQLRVKEQPQSAILELALEANRLCLEYGAKLIVNDYPEIALLCGAYGVHLGLDDIPVPEARIILGKDSCIGGTANTFEDVLQRTAEGVDYIGLGPFRFTSTKKNLSPVLGMEGYIRIMEQMREAGITIPVIAIGGIEQADIDPILKTGIYGIAVSGLLTRENDLKKDFYVNYSK
ncbi:thiamine phosphate synthase [Pedobacter sp. L105]|uniref:thiamine phosphate synthase n=1 Tax=Pedobacter sp. L105 TaxID=1641871 RepID=UPI00131DC454|nr:thiamine phosphate synthase [Pedobacter sp. L105]